MTNDQIVQALRECANSLRRVATRRTVVPDDENDLRLVASSLDHVALEFATAAKQSVRLEDSEAALRRAGYVKPGVDR